MSGLTIEDKNMLLIWSEYGQRPYDGILEEDKSTQFLQMLNNNQVTGPIYRGTNRHSHLKVGDMLDYDIPKSWTFSKTSAINFIEDSSSATLLIIEKGIYNGIEKLIFDQFSGSIFD